MEKRWNIQIDPELEGSSIRQILREKLRLSKNQISRIKFQESGILLNGERKRVTDMVKAGDNLSVLLEREEKISYLEPESGEISVLYEDEDLLLIKKERGIVCHPGPGHYKNSLANQVTRYLLEKKENAVIREVGRLDRDTSGIVVFAKNRIAAQKLSKQREKGLFWKQYIAAIDGILEKKEGEIRLPIGPKQGSLLKMCVRKDGKAGITRYQVIREYETKSILLCTLLTGRTHQIRVHMAAIGHPILGDELYGSEKTAQVKGLCLHAYKVCLFQPFTGEKIETVWKLEKEQWQEPHDLL